MIRVVPKPEPAEFDARVRQHGRAWLQERGWLRPQSLPAGTGKELPTYWRECLGELHRRYDGICAYLCVYIERVTGGATVDHFIAKSPRPDLAYEWDNYRLACSIMNSRKRDYSKVMDPFTIHDGWFRLELVSGSIYPSPELEGRQQEQVAYTIKRLGLDDAGNRELRARHFQDFLEGEYTAAFLRKRSPFVYQEALREGYLE
ncbi:hypothetical protein ACR80S_13505 [Halomonas sp. MA07-2]|uniref:hypothetical protein n=1 Tax=Halomonas sp. MA07-2 TaxID=3440841 RepID=UPI003EF07250